MIDIHSHLIPKVDDGARNVKETFELLKEASDAGFSDIFLTPHYIINESEQNINELNVWKDKLQEAVKKEKLPIKLHLGMEIYITEEIIQLIKENKVLPLANSKYILIELPVSTNILCLKSVIYKLINNGITPVIAHPERCKYVQENLDVIEQLVKDGCLLQCNYVSILGKYGRPAKKTLKILLKKNLVHFLGSDCHRPNTVYPIIKKATKKITKIVGKERINFLTTTNAMKIINN